MLKLFAHSCACTFDGGSSRIYAEEAALQRSGKGRSLNFCASALAVRPSTKALSSFKLAFRDAEASLRPTGSRRLPPRITRTSSAINFKRCFVLAACVLIITLPMWSQANKRDPLNDKEVDQLRETAIEPDKRLKLYVQFTRERMDNIEKLRNDPKAPPDRGTKIHDLLEDVASLVDEIDDNVENYDERNADLRKLLKEVIQMDSEFQTKLQQMKAFADDPKNSAQSTDYKFALDDAIDSVNSSADSSRKLLVEQNVKFEKKKKK